jgi:hypothetical protein
MSTYDSLPFDQSDRTYLFQLHVSEDKHFFMPAAVQPIRTAHLRSHQCSMVKRRFRPAAYCLPLLNLAIPPLHPRQPSRLFPASPTAKLLDLVSARIDQGGVQRRAIGRASPTRLIPNR